MTASRDDILAAIRRQRAPEAPLPDVAEGPWITFPDPRAHFATVLSDVGGACFTVISIEETLSRLEQIPAFATAAKVYSTVPGISSKNVDPRSITDPHELHDIDFAVLPGRIAVAENAAVWVTDGDVPHRVIYFIAQHVALVVPDGNVVHNMHEAYQQIQLEGTGFGCFISGPSKTADIEQSLVIGAHGARSMTVFLVRGSLASS